MGEKLKQKKRIYNLLMLGAIVVVVFSAVMVVGSVKGWFDKGQSTTVSEKIGNVNIKRSGIAYALKDGTALRDEDQIETLNRSGITIITGESNRTALNEKTVVQFVADDNGKNLIQLDKGQIFAQRSGSNAMGISTGGYELSWEDAVFSVSAPTGSLNVYVYAGTVTVGETVVEKGKALSIATKSDGGTEMSVTDLSIQAMNAFDIKGARKAGEEQALCFSNQELEALAAGREKEKILSPGKTIDQVSPQPTAASGKEESTALPESSAEDNAASGGSQNSTAKPEIPVTPGATEKPKPVPTPDPTLEPAPVPTPETPIQKTCTITIQCDTILNNMGDLDEGKSGYVPENGYILGSSEIAFEEGETVFDVLSRACEMAGIQLEYSWTPMLDSYYIEGINNLYEFDCGNESGWVYKVNGWFPNYGCSAYTVSEGDSIVWCYTCKGLGADVGGGVS